MPGGDGYGFVAEADAARAFGECVSDKYVEALDPLRHLAAGEIGAQVFDGVALGEVVESGERRAVIKLWGGFEHGGLAVGCVVSDREHAAGYAAELVGNRGEIIRSG